MKTKIAGLSAAAVLAASLSMPASAAFITGTISFSNGLDTLGNIVSNLTVFDIGAPTNASGGTGSFLGVSGLTTTSDIDIGAPGGVIYSIGGFSFTLTSISAISIDALACSGGLCEDGKEFNIAGTVTGAGFDASTFIGKFTANGTCLEDQGAPGSCSAGTQSGSWSSSVVATGRPSETPVPATLALLGLALAGLGWTRRSKA